MIPVELGSGFTQMGQSRHLLPFIFGLFKQTSLQFLQQIYVQKCPFSIWCLDSNSLCSEHESPPITTRPGLPPLGFGFYVNPATLKLEPVLIGAKEDTRNETCKNEIRKEKKE